MNPKEAHQQAPTTIIPSTLTQAALSLHNQSTISVLQSAHHSLSQSMNNSIDVYCDKDEVNELLLVQQDDEVYPRTFSK